MPTYRSDEILQIIKVAVVPNSTIKYFAQEQLPGQRLYPSVEVNNVKPEFTTEKHDITETKNRFSITIFDRYGSNRAKTTEQLRTLEQNIIALLEVATLDADEDLTVGKVILEQRDFTRGTIRVNPKQVNGIQSVLIIEIIEVQATETGVPLGGQNTFSIGTIIDAQVYDLPKERNEDNVEITHNAANTRTKSFVINQDHQFFVTIGYITARKTELDTLKAARAQVTGTLKRNGVAESKVGFLTVVENGAPFRGIETLDIMMEII